MGTEPNLMPMFHEDLTIRRQPVAAGRHGNLIAWGIDRRLQPSLKVPKEQGCVPITGNEHKPVGTHSCKPCQRVNLTSVRLQQLFKPYRGARFRTAVVRAVRSTAIVGGTQDVERVAVQHEIDRVVSGPRDGVEKLGEFHRPSEAFLGEPMSAVVAAASHV
jgi:hypothetical protein